MLQDESVSLTDPRAELLVWKATWLPGSETFVRNQVDALETWTATCLGMKKVTSPMSRDSDVVLFGDGLADKLRRHALLRTRHSRSLRHALETLRPSVVHSHFASDATLIAPEAIRAGIPLVVTAHGADVLSPGAHAQYIRSRISSTLKGADQVIAVSSFLASHVAALGVDTRRIRVHYTGIPVCPEPDLTAEREWDIAFVGRLVDRKGIVDAITATALAQEQTGRVLKMCVMGDGPLRPTIEAQARAQGVDLAMLGHVTPERVGKELSSSRIFLAPSKTSQTGGAEAFGMVFLEAAARGIPVVAYRHAGVVEAVADGRSGVLADEGDIAGLASALTSFLRSAQRRIEYGAFGRKRVEADFDIRTQTRKLEAVFDSVTRR